MALLFGRGSVALPFVRARGIWKIVYALVADRHLDDLSCSLLPTELAELVVASFTPLYICIKSSTRLGQIVVAGGLACQILEVIESILLLAAAPVEVDRLAVAVVARPLLR